MSKKLFLLFMMATLTVIFMMSVASRWSFDQHFLGYITQQEEQRTEVLVEQLALQYEIHGNWEFLRNNTNTWRKILRLTIINLPPQPEQFAPHLTDRHAPQARNIRLPPITVYDNDYQYVIGIPQRDIQKPNLLPIQLQEQVIGWLARNNNHFEQFQNQIDQQFQAHHQKILWFITAGALLLAALLAWIAAQQFLSPLKKITAGVHELAKGNYHIKLNMHNQDELGKLATDINHLAQRLAMHEHNRKQFIADISHELRTPLTILQGEIEAVEDGIRPLNEHTLSSVKQEVSILNRLINDLHQLSLADLGKLECPLQPIAVLPLLKEMIEKFEAKWQAHQITVTLDMQLAQNTIIHGNTQRLQQVFYNLFENTCRYTHSPGKLQITVFKNKNADAIDQFNIWLADSAPGVTDSQLPDLFKCFYRTDHSRNRNTGGSGLGLAICAEIIRLHNGNITAEHNIMGGVHIKITLPFANLN